MSQERADATLALVDELGINHIDTAAGYGDSEDRLKPFLADHGQRFYLATKTGEREGDAARAELEHSLQRMGVDHVDLIQLHNLVETDEWWLDSVKDEFAGHPYKVLHPLDNTYGMLLFSRLELIDPKIRFLVNEGVPSIHCRYPRR